MITKMSELEREEEILKEEIAELSVIEQEYQSIWGYRDDNNFKG